MAILRATPMVLRTTRSGTRYSPIELAQAVAWGTGDAVAKEQPTAAAQIDAAVPVNVDLHSIVQHALQ